jgi:hypothetical protein
MIFFQWFSARMNRVGAKGDPSQLSFFGLASPSKALRTLGQMCKISLFKMKMDSFYLTAGLGSWCLRTGDWGFF